MPFGFGFQFGFARAANAIQWLSLSAMNASNTAPLDSLVGDDVTQIATGAVTIPAYVDEVLGADLVDAGIVAASWTASGTSTIADDDGAVKITYTDNVNGGYLALSAAGDLSTNLTIGQRYRVNFNAKKGTGSPSPRTDTGDTVAVTTTDYAPYTFTFVATSATNNVFYAYPGVGGSIWIKDVVIRPRSDAGLYLTTISANNPAIPGAGYRDSAWYATDSEGAAIATPTVLASGLTRYDGSGLGNVILPSFTNKCTCMKYNPTATTGLTQGGDAGAVLSIVDDTAALTAAGLISLCTLGDVYKLDNSAGVATAYVLSGATGAVTTKHSASAYVRGGAGRVGISGLTSTSFGASESYVKRQVENITIDGTSRATIVLAEIGSVVYFILPSLTETTTAPPFPVITLPTDAAAASTMAARYTSIPGTNLGTAFNFVLYSYAASGRVWNMLYDGTNILKHDGTNIVFTDGTTTLSAALAITANTQYHIGLDTTPGAWSLSVEGTEVDSDATGDAVTWGETVYIGSKVVTGTASETLSGTLTVLQSSSDAMFDETSEL